MKPVHIRRGRVLNPWLVAASCIGLLAITGSAEAQWDVRAAPMGVGHADYQFDPNLPGPAVRMIASGGISEVGPSTRLGLEATQWVRPNAAIIGRFVAGADVSTVIGSPSRSVATMQLGAVRTIRETNNRMLVAGTALGFDINLWENLKGTTPDAGTAARVPPDENDNRWTGDEACSAAACGDINFSGSVKTNAALMAGILSRDNDRERTLMLRGEMVGLSGYSLTLNVGIGPITHHP